MKKFLLYVLFGLVAMSYGWLMCYAWENQIAKEAVVEYYPLMKHTILAGRSAKVIYIERWTDETNMTSCSDFDIVWPAGASQGYIDYMLEHAKGKQEHHFKQIGWWKKEIK